MQQMEQQMKVLMSQVQSQATKLQEQDAQALANEEKIERQEMQIDLEKALAGRPNTGRPSAKAIVIQTAARKSLRGPRALQIDADF